MAIAFENTSLPKKLLWRPPRLHTRRLTVKQPRAIGRELGRLCPELAHPNRYDLRCNRGLLVADDLHGADNPALPSCLHLTRHAASCVVGRVEPIFCLQARRLRCCGRSQLPSTEEHSIRRISTLCISRFSCISSR